MITEELLAAFEEGKTNAEETALFAKSAAAVRATNDVLKEINVL